MHHLKISLFAFATLVTISLPAAASEWTPPLITAQSPLTIDRTYTAPRDAQIEEEIDPSITSAVADLSVNCQGLKTVVRKGDRSAVMIDWNYAGFGRDYTPAKRCQIVSARLQQAANLNGGTFKELQLASGILNAQTIICALQANQQSCTSRNILFTLKPENARNPELVVQKIFTFAQDGSSSLDESASSKGQVDLNLGKWEQQAFARKSKQARTTGF